MRLTYNTYLSLEDETFEGKSYRKQLPPRFDQPFVAWVRFIDTSVF